MHFHSWILSARTANFELGAVERSKVKPNYFVMWCLALKYMTLYQAG